jgi:hypothetical protein
MSLLINQKRRIEQLEKQLAKKENDIAEIGVAVVDICGQFGIHVFDPESLQKITLGKIIKSITWKAATGSLNTNKLMQTLPLVVEYEAPIKAKIEAEKAAQESTLKIVK